MQGSEAHILQSRIHQHHGQQRKRKMKGFSRQVQERGNLKLKGPGQTRDGFGQEYTRDDSKKILSRRKDLVSDVFGRAIQAHSYQLSHGTC